MICRREVIEFGNEFLMRGSVFTDDLTGVCDLVGIWLDCKKSDEDDPRLGPHSIELFKYFDA